MYKPGDLELNICTRVIGPDDECNEGPYGYYCWHDDETGRAYTDDSRNDERSFAPLVFLPHSCDSWVIGGIEQIDAMIADLTEARRRILEATEKGSFR